MNFVKNKKKLILGIVTSVVALSVMVTGVLALFSDKEIGNISGHVGSLGIAFDTKLVDELTGSPKLENATNINPGDNDYDNLTGGNNSGTSHKFTFRVVNTGNKAMMTKAVIDVSFINNTVDLDQNFLKLYNLDKTHIIEKYLVKIDGSVVRISDNTGVVTTPSGYNIKDYSGVRYVVDGPVLNGIGANAEVISGGTDSFSHVSQLALDRETNNDYMNTDVNIKVTILGIQYQNALNSDWDSLIKDGVIK